MKAAWGIPFCLLALTAAAGCSASTEVAPDVQQQAAAGQPVTLRIMHVMDGSHPDALKAVTDSVTRRNPRIKFDIQQTSTVQYAELLKTKMASGAAPDIVFGKVSEYTDIVKAGQIFDLSGQPFVDRMTDEVKKMMTVDGKIYGIAEDVFTLGVFYNKDMFKQYGLEVPATYSEYVRVMETFRNNGIPPFARTYKEQQWIRLEFLSEWRVIAAQKYPNFFLDIQSGAAKLSDYPEFRDTLARFAKRLSYKSGDELGMYAYQALQSFAGGKFPMMILHSGNLTDIRKNNPEGHFGFFASAFSDNPDENKIFESPDSAFMITSQSKHKAEALELFDYMLSPEGWNDWSTHVSAIPAMKNAAPAKSEPMIDDILAYQKAGKITGDVFLYTGEAKKKEFEMYQQFASKPGVNVDEFVKQWEKQFQGTNAP
ncbi:ABC transporter substrate-binding protein [Paenibacillus thalictri]|uniref:Extracellular solute-binding protein n=1 Tax=Paenibacillus thalictri TaxID=2527873 RepID=A0A4Q9DVJ5_9BACL|nr:extracellular solute-binding protein [Paenibacillus thalictri]TBL81067.1 extracellular solute-binding protein [Paenibacillus thalictri]